MLAMFPDTDMDAMLDLTNGHLDHLAYVASYIRFKNPGRSVNPSTVRSALDELLREKQYQPPLAKSVDRAAADSEPFVKPG